MIDKKNFFFYLLPSIVSGIIGIVLIPISTFFLDPKDFGIFAIISAIVIPITALSSTGANWVLSPHFYKVSEKEKQMLATNILFYDAVSKILWMTVFFILSPHILPLFIDEYNPEYLLYFRFNLIALLLASFTASISYIFILEKSGKRHAILELIGPLISASVTIFCLMWLNLKTVSLFLGPLVAEVISLFLGLWLVRHWLHGKLQKYWASEIWKIGMPSIPLDFVNLLTAVADRFFIRYWLNLSSLGLYFHSTNYRSIFNLGLKAFNRTYVPHILERYSNAVTGVKPNDSLRTPLQKWFGVVGIGGIFVTFFSFEVVDFLTHGKFIGAVPLIPLWYLIVITTTYGSTYTQYLFIHKKSYFRSISGIILSGISLGISAGFIVLFGLIGAVVAAIVSNLITQISFSWYARRCGCSPIGEKDSIVTGLFMLGLYFFNSYFDPSFLVRSILAIFISMVIIKYFQLWGFIARSFVHLKNTLWNSISA